MFGNIANVPDITIDDLRSFMDSHKEHEFMLVDVREPEEYEQDHIPGARHIPLMDLVEGRVEVRPAAHTFFYCRSGARSRMGAQAVAAKVGLERIFNVRGGIMAYTGQTLPDMPNVKVFDGTEDLNTLLLRAMDLEKGAERLYGAVLARFEGTPVADLVKRLEEAEEGHARALYSMLRKVTDDPAGLAPFETMYEGLEGLVLESGEPLVQRLAWVADGNTEVASVLEVALELELKAYDLYRNMADRTDDSSLKVAFLDIASQERRHARTVARALGKLANS